MLLQDDGEGSSARAAWERLALGYWKPLFVFLRRKGLDHDVAADAIQGFFAHLLNRDFLRKIERGNGLFRSFLLKALQNWRTDQHRAATAQKRGDGEPVIAFHEIEEVTSSPSGDDVFAEERSTAGGHERFTTTPSRNWASVSVVADGRHTFWS